MTFGEKLSRLRRENNLTQEQLAAALGVSRQAVGKWESGITYPETDKLIRMSDLFHCSLDYLLKDTVVEPQAPHSAPWSRRLPRERKSERTLWGLPLWHIGRNARGIVAVGLNARGIVAIGLKARGIVSLGMLSVGFLSLGMLSLGLLSLGMLALGILSAGCFSVGVFAAGAISLGIISLGAIAVGDFSVGALAVGNYFALGDNARAAIALGDTKAVGSLYQHIGPLSAGDWATVKELLNQIVPSVLTWAKALLLLFL